MAISYVTEQHGGSSTSNLSVAVGDTLIAIARNDGSGALPTVPSGWGTVVTGGQSGSFNGHVMASRVATSTSEASGTWTNADSLDIVAYRDVDHIGDVQIASQTASSNLIPTTALSMEVSDGSSAVGIWIGRRNNNGSLPTISGFTNRISNDIATDDGRAWSAWWDDLSATAYAGGNVDWGSGTATGAGDSIVFELVAATAPTTAVVLGGELSAAPQITIEDVTVGAETVAVSGYVAAFDAFAVVEVGLYDSGDSLVDSAVGVIVADDWSAEIDLPAADTGYYVVATITQTLADTEQTDDATSDAFDVASTGLSAPSSVTATAISDSEITVSWTDESTAEDGHYVYWGLASDELPYGAVVPSGTNEYTVTGLLPETLYYFRVFAYAGATLSTPSSTASETTDAAAATGAIVSVSISPTTTSKEVGQTQSFSATVVGTGDYTTDVTWSVIGGAATVNSSGVMTATAPGVATIRATSDDDPTKYGEATATIVPSGGETTTAGSAWARFVRR